MAQQRVIRTALTGMSAVLLATMSSVSANAADRGHGNGTRIQSAMSVIAIDTQQAAKAGNRVVYQGGYTILLSGTTGREIARVPEKGTAVAAASPIVTGNCGTNWIFMSDNRNYDNVFTFQTGFEVNGSAYDFDWYVSFTTSANDYWTWTDSGPQWPSSTWETNPTDEYTAFNGWVKGKVSTSSRAYLTDGRVCWSGGPWDEEYVS